MKIYGSKTIKVLLIFAIDDMLILSFVCVLVCVCVFDNENDAELFFDFINSQHPNIKFTIEKETNMVQAFLDVCIDNNDPSCLKTSIYREKDLY